MARTNINESALLAAIVRVRKRLAPRLLKEAILLEHVVDLAFDQVCDGGARLRCHLKKIVGRLLG